MEMFLHDLKFEGEDDWTKKFNECSDYFQKFQDESLTEEQRDYYWDLFWDNRQLLELGIY